MLVIQVQLTRNPNSAFENGSSEYSYMWLWIPAKKKVAIVELNVEYCFAKNIRMGTHDIRKYGGRRPSIKTNEWSIKSDRLEVRCVIKYDWGIPMNFMMRLVNNFVLFPTKMKKWSCKSASLVSLVFHLRFVHFAQCFSAIWIQWYPKWNVA